MWPELKAMRNYVQDHPGLPAESQEGLMDFARSYGLVKRDLEAPGGPPSPRDLRPLHLGLLHNAYRTTVQGFAQSGRPQAGHDARQALPRMMTGFGAGPDRAGIARDMMAFSAMLGTAHTAGQALQPANVMAAADRFGPGGPLIAAAFLRGEQVKAEAVQRGLLDADGDLRDLEITDAEAEHAAQTLMAGCDDDSDMDEMSEDEEQQEPAQT